MGVFDWLFGTAKPEVEPAPPLKNFPTREDADFARKSGAFYGTAIDPFARGQSAMFLSDAEGPASGEGIEIGDLVDPRFSHRFDPAVAANGRYTADSYARSALAANRSAVSTLGMDPRKFAMDPVLDAEKMTLGGVYSPETDAGFVIPGPSADAASTLAHESIHRGLQQLRNSGNLPAFSSERAEPRTEEEALVRLIMQKYMGDPEQGPEALKMKKQAYPDFFSGDLATQKYVDDYIAKIEAAAAQQLARDKPRGPR
jgi:hypothetical protein